MPEIPTRVPTAVVSSAKPATGETNPERASKHQETKQSELPVLSQHYVEQPIPNLAAIMEEAKNRSRRLKPARGGSPLRLRAGQSR